MDSLTSDFVIRVFEFNIQIILIKNELKTKYVVIHLRLHKHYSKILVIVEILEYTVKKYKNYVKNITKMSNNGLIPNSEEFFSSLVIGFCTNCLCIIKCLKQTGNYVQNMKTRAKARYFF